MIEIDWLLSYIIFTMEHRKINFRHIKNILIIRTGAIGDIILFLSALQPIRKKFSSAFIEMMGYRDRLFLLEDSGYIDKITSIEDRDLFSLFIENVHPKGGLLQYLNQFDLIFSFVDDEDFSSNIRNYCKGMMISIPPFPPDGWKRHITDYLLDLLKKYGIKSNNNIPELYVGENKKKMARDFLKSNGINPIRDMIMAIHPGSGSKKKNWPLKGFFEIAEWMVEKYHARILLIIGPAEELMKEEILDKMKDLRPVIAENFPLKLLSGLMVSCRLYIGNDSGITHLAAALGIPVISLFGPTDPDIWGPKGRRVVILKGDTDCSPCSEGVRAECEEISCMDSITTEKVKKRIELLIESEE